MSVNLFVTNKCIKNCSFCFNTKMNGTEPSLEQLKAFVDNLHQNDQVKLLGGEPSLHSKFLELLRYIQSTGRRTVLFTNLLTDHEIWKKVVKFVVNNCSSSEFAIVANSTQLYGERQRVYQKNLDLFKDFETIGITFSYTIGDDFDMSCIDFDYIQNILSSNNRYIRLSCQVPFPGSKSTVFNNKNLGNHIQEFIKKLNLTLPQIREKVNFDCLLLPCWFSDDVWEKYGKFMKRFRQFCECPPTDLFLLNNEYKFIYGLCCPDIEYDVKNIESVDYDKVKNILSNKYHSLEIKLGTIDVCTNCKYFEKECGGGCLPMKRQFIEAA